MTFETKEKGLEWLVTNGFTHIPPDTTKSSLWTPGYTTVTFKDASPFGALNRVATTCIEATLMPVIPAGVIICGDVE